MPGVPFCILFFFKACWSKRFFKVRDYKLMLKLFDQIIREAPAFEDNDFVGFPINAILEW